MNVQQSLRVKNLATDIFSFLLKETSLSTRIDTSVKKNHEHLHHSADENTFDCFNVRFRYEGIVSKTLCMLSLCIVLANLQEKR